MQLHADLVAATAARLVAAGLCSGRVEIDRDRPAKVSDMPFAVVQVIEDKATADGHAETGVPDFVHETTLCVDVVRKGSSGEAIKAQLYADGENVLQALLADPTWLALIDGVGGVHTAYLPADESDVQAAGMRVALTVKHRSTWPPVITDDLVTVAVGLDGDGDGARDTGFIATLPTS